MSDGETMRLSQEEIAKHFVLPERKSKIATLLKNDGQKYCICRSSDSSRFMIACDGCEEWYHGDCIGLRGKDARLIRQYFCMQCQDADPTLSTKFKPGVKAEIEARYGSPQKKKRKDRNKLADISASKHAFNKQSENEKSPRITRSRHRPCRRCDNCRRTQECGECSACSKGRGDCIKMQCLEQVKYQESEEADSKNHVTNKRKDGDLRSAQNRGRDGKERQCLGYQCVMAALPGSKYCSDACGMWLATNRIFQVLPQRLNEWKLTPSVADEISKCQLESVREQQQQVKGMLLELDKRREELEVLIEHSKGIAIDENQDVDMEDETEMSMYCVTCGQEVHSRTAIRHMERCFNKHESQTSFGSIYKTRLDDINLFCDFYNPQNRTYCKRLRVLCPEHVKDPKVGDTEVCGCPLVTNVFDLNGEFCRVAKKLCNRHYCWEKLRRAEIDIEKVRQWLKIDELIEQEQQIRKRMADRAGLLALMLHSTYNHDIMDGMPKCAPESSTSEPLLEPQNVIVRM